MSFSWSQVLATQTAGPTLLRLRLATPTTSDGAPGFTTPGQYTQLRVGDTMGYFAIASEPGLPEFEFLVKRGSPIGEALSRTNPGDMIEVGPIAGNGFPVQLATGHDLLLVATGTGSAPMRSVVESLVRARCGVRRVTFVHGVRHPVEAAWLEDRARWAAADVDWRVVVSQPDAGWHGRAGRVQHHLEGLADSETTVFLCGQKPMVADVRSALAAQGVRPTQIHLNAPS